MSQNNLFIQCILYLLYTHTILLARIKFHQFCNLYGYKWQNYTCPAKNEFAWSKFTCGETHTHITHMHTHTYTHTHTTYTCTFISSHAVSCSEVPVYKLHAGKILHALGNLQTHLQEEFLNRSHLNTSEWCTYS